MRTLLLAVTLFAVSATGALAASTDYYLKLDGVEGESTKAEATTQVEVKTPRAETTGGVQVSAGDVTGDSTGSAKGNVEFEWKVEEGEKTPGVEPDEIDAMDDDDDGDEFATNFGVLLGGGSDDSDDDEERLHGLERARLVIEENARASDQAIESISLNFEKITTRVKHEVRVFGFIPVEATADVDVDASGEVTVRFPWWAIFASGKDSDNLGLRIRANLSNVLKTKHDTVKNSINNVR